MSIVKSLWKKYRSQFFCMLNSRCAKSAVVINSAIDRSCAIRQKCRVYNTTMGRYSYVARNTLMQNCTVGSFCSISESCNIGMPSHPTHMVSMSPVFHKGRNILKTRFGTFDYARAPRTYIGNDVWIGSRAQIKSGLTIGNGAVIGAGAVVTRDVPPYAIVGGVPAKLIRMRFSEDDIAKIEETKWWMLDEKTLEKACPYFDEADRLRDYLGGNRT